MIVERLDEYYAKHQERQPFRFRPSNMGGCLRKLAWLLQGIEPDPLPVETIRTFELGTQRGAKLEEVAKEIWPWAQTQVPLSLSVGKFRIEGWLDLWIPELRTIVDFKTIGAFGAGLLPTEGPSLEYQLQLNAYRHGIILSSEMRLADIHTLLVYEVKDSDVRKGVKAGQLIEVEVPYTQELEEAYQKRLTELERLLILKELGQLDPRKIPELPLEKGKHSWKCRYCSVGEDRGECYEKR